MVSDAAHREREVGAELLPQPQPARVARRFLLRFDTAELDTGRTLGGVARQAAPLEVVGAMLDVAPELLVHLTLERRAAEEVADSRADAADERPHNDLGVARSAAVMPATTCSQLERSVRSCFRPSVVSV